MATASGETQRTAEGACACGSVRFVVKLPVLGCSHCHCRSCRRHHGAAFVTWCGVTVENFSLTGEEHVRWHVTPHGTNRGFCVHCGSPCLFTSPHRQGEIHVARASLLGDVDVTPVAHIFFDRHATWFPFKDALPRLGGKNGVQLLEGRRHPKIARAWQNVRYAMTRLTMRSKRSPAR